MSDPQHPITSDTSLPQSLDEAVDQLSAVMCAPAVLALPQGWASPWHRSDDGVPAPGERRGALKSFKIGRRRLVPIGEPEESVRRQIEESAENVCALAQA